MKKAWVRKSVCYLIFALQFYTFGSEFELFSEVQFKFVLDVKDNVITNSDISHALFYCKVDNRNVLRTFVD